MGHVGLQVRISALRELFKTFYGLIAVEEVSYDSQEHPNLLTELVVLRI